MASITLTSTWTAAQVDTLYDQIIAWFAASAAPWNLNRDGLATYLKTGPGRTDSDAIATEFYRIRGVKGGQQLTRDEFRAMFGLAPATTPTTPGTTSALAGLDKKWLVLAGLALAVYLIVGGSRR